MSLDSSLDSIYLFEGKAIYFHLQPKKTGQKLANIAEIYQNSPKISAP